MFSSGAPARERGDAVPCNALWFQRTRRDAREIGGGTDEASITRYVLLVKNEFGGFEDEAIERGPELGGWSWNAKFADVDNDGWKDLHISNGFFQSDTRESNIFYLNNQDGHFTDKTVPWGLEDFRVTTSHTYVDIDNDGDLDIVTVPVFGTVRVVENTGNGNNAIAIELHDGKTNSYAIGAKFIVHFGTGAKRQMWEVQSGGGFLSFDPLVSHLGPGPEKQADAVEIIWPNGEKDEIKGPFMAGARYVITRRSWADPRKESVLPRPG